MENELVAQTAEQLDEAKRYEITSHGAYQIVAEIIKTDKQLAKEIEASFKPTVEKANATHKEALKAMNAHLDPIVEAEKILKQKMVDWIMAHSDVLDQIPKVEGVSIKNNNKWEITDMTAIKPRYMTIDREAINKAVNALGEEAETMVGGIKVFKSVGVSIRL